MGFDFREGNVGELENGFSSGEINMLEVVTCTMELKKLTPGSVKTNRCLLAVETRRFVLSSSRAKAVMS